MWGVGFGLGGFRIWACRLRAQALEYRLENYGASESWQLYVGSSSID